MLTLILRKSLSGYNLFFKETFAEINLDFKDSSKMISEKWKKLDDASKTEYNDKASSLPAKKKHKTSAYNKYVAAQFKTTGKSGIEGITELAKKWNKMTFEQKSEYGRVKDPNKEVKLTGYTLFVKSNFGKLHDTGSQAKDTFEKIAKKWESLSDSEKESFKEKASK